MRWRSSCAGLRLHASRRSCASSSIQGGAHVVEMWDVAAAMSTLLARAQARTSLGCTNHHGIRAKTVPQTSGTRTGISLEVLAIFLAKILSILCWHACAFLLVEVKRSAQTKSSPVDVGRRLNAVDFVCFIALLKMPAG